MFHPLDVLTFPACSFKTEAVSTIICHAELKSLLTRGQNVLGVKRTLAWS